MKENLFLQAEFMLLVAFSVVVPGAIFWFMVARRAISRPAVLALGLVLILVGGVDIGLLHILAGKGATEAHTLGARIFASEVSIGLYLLPALFAGIGINLVSHVLIHHLVRAEQRFDQNHPPATPTPTRHDRAHRDPPRRGPLRIPRAGRRRRAVRRPGL